MKVFRNDLGHASSLRLFKELFLEGLTFRRAKNVLPLGADCALNRRVVSRRARRADHSEAFCSRGPLSRPDF